MSDDNKAPLNLPTDPVVLEKLRKGIEEIANSLTRIQGERDFIKEAIKSLKEETEVDKKSIRAMGKIYYAGNMKRKIEDVNDLACLYEATFKVKVAGVGEDDEENE